jgi:hypothetical protein
MLHLPWFLPLPERQLFQLLWEVKQSAQMAIPRPPIFGADGTIQPIGGFLDKSMGLLAAVRA